MKKTITLNMYEVGVDDPPTMTTHVLGFSGYWNKWKGMTYHPEGLGEAPFGGDSSVTHWIHPIPRPIDM